MPLNSNEDVSPYFDDFDETKDFYKIKFKPSVPVQARELNQLQSILQKQIERFGDNIFKTGSIVDGCHITLHEKFPYVKINDLETDGSAVDVKSFDGYYLKNSSNLQAMVLTSVAGYQINSPDLNTMYVKYINSGDSKSEATYVADQVLTVFDPSAPINNISVTTGSAGFSNTDLVVFTNSIRVQNTSSGNGFANVFAVGNFINNGLGANVQITAVTGASDGIILRYKPQANSLSSGNTAQWTFSVGQSIINNNTGETGTIVEEYGSGARAKIQTNNIGAVANVIMVSAGSGYTQLPYVSIRSSTANTTQIAFANLIPETFLAKVTVANTLNLSIGEGYGMSMEKGVIYQKGYFQRIEPQLVVIEKYSTTPDLKAVGFQTEEEIVDSNQDDSLLSNAQGYKNYAGPGADRLKLTPKLVVADKNVATANSEFLSIVEFTEGNAYRQNNQTQYNIIEKEIAKRSYEQAGDFVTDQFLSTTRSTPNFSDEANNISFIVDPGIAYINGFRVENKANYVASVAKAKDTVIVDNNISMNYGNYIRVTNLAGLLDFSTGDVVQLRTAAASYYSNPNGTITAPGTSIGFARVRSIVSENQQQGIYRVYLFNITMDSGKNFKNVKAIYYNGTTKGVADAILDANGFAVLYDNNYSTLAFYTGFDAVKNANNISYNYKQIDTGRSANTTGYISKTLTGNETFPFSGALSAAEKESVLIVPSVAISASANLAGSATTSTTSATVTGTSTTFLTDVYVGDYLKFANSTANTIGKVAYITNNTSLVLTANASATISGANVSSYFPAYVPVNLGNSTRTVNVSANSTQMTVYLGSGITSSSNVIMTTDVLVTNTTPETKLVKRSQFVRIDCNSNIAANTGPWCLGTVDIFRLRNVYLGANTTFLANSASVLNVTNNFYIDHNQNEDYYDLGYLFKKPGSSLTLATSQSLLIEYDCFTASEGVTWVNSYPINDTLQLANSSSTINTVEIPEMYGLKDQYYDLRDVIDFRPRALNTVTLTANAALAQIDPIENTYSGRFSATAKKFPSPNQTLSGKFEYYLPRKDRVVLGENGNIRVIQGVPGEEFPIKPDNAIILDDLDIPAYPSLPFALSVEEQDFVDTKVANEKYTNQRADKYKVISRTDPAKRNQYQTKAYTMKDIGQLERRIETLEYYVSFNFEENVAKNRSIPSALDASAERFKFGFFVDSFDDARFSDYKNPEFNADFVNGRLVAKADRINIEFEPLDTSAQSGGLVTYPFEEFTIVGQMQATVEPDTTSSSNTSSNTTPTIPSDIVTTQVITSQVISNKNTQVNINGLVSEITEFKMSAQSGPVEIYLNFRDNDNAIEIYQGTTAGFSTTGLTPIYDGLSVVALTAGDKLVKAAGLGKLESLNPPVYLGSPSKPAIEDAGKILFTHDPSGGQYYQIKVIKYRKSGGANNWKGKFIYRIYYPIDTYAVTYVPALPSLIPYRGTVVITPDTFSVQTMYNYLGISANLPVSGQQIFRIVTNGLKPNTQHTFYFSGSDHSSKTKMLGSTLGAQLVSDSSGSLIFDYFYNDAGVTSDSGLQNQFNAGLGGIKSISISSADGQSLATAVIGAKPYVSKPINTTTTISIIPPAGGRSFDRGNIRNA